MGENFRPFSIEINEIVEILKGDSYEEPTIDIVTAGCDAIHPGHSVMSYY